jgi:hypothetical protein
MLILNNGELDNCFPAFDSRSDVGSGATHSYECQDSGSNADQRADSRQLLFVPGHV